jgi:hypothetical protein
LGQIAIELASDFWCGDSHKIELHLGKELCNLVEPFGSNFTLKFADFEVEAGSTTIAKSLAAA